MTDLTKLANDYNHFVKTDNQTPVQKLKTTTDRQNELNTKRQGIQQDIQKKEDQALTREVGTGATGALLGAASASLPKKHRSPINALIGASAGTAVGSLAGKLSSNNIRQDIDNKKLELTDVEAERDANRQKQLSIEEQYGLQPKVASDESKRRNIYAPGLGEDAHKKALSETAKAYNKANKSGDLTVSGKQRLQQYNAKSDAPFQTIRASDFANGKGNTYLKGVDSTLNKSASDESSPQPRQILLQRDMPDGSVKSQMLVNQKDTRDFINTNSDFRNLHNETVDSFEEHPIIQREKGSVDPKATAAGAGAGAFFGSLVGREVAKPGRKLRGGLLGGAVSAAGIGGIAELARRKNKSNIENKINKAEEVEWASPHGLLLNDARKKHVLKQ